MSTRGGTRAVVFDLDGTLVDSLTDLAESMNAVLNLHACPAHPVRRYRQYVGEGVRRLVVRALPLAARAEGFVATCEAEMRNVYGMRWGRHTAPYPGILDLVSALARRGFRLGVLTNKPHGFAVRIIERNFAPGTFAAVMGADRGFSHKPDPAGALELARQLGVASEKCFYVGDTGTDMKTAVAAGMTPIGCLWGFRDAVELEEAGAVRLVKDVRELAAAIAGD
jgi:phosphoglycolate phosphatase